jgi:hypothetical protein
MLVPLEHERFEEDSMNDVTVVEVDAARSDGFPCSADAAAAVLLHLASERFLE